MPVTPSESGEASHRIGGTMRSGGISCARSTPESAGIILVSAGPPGTRTFAVTPVPPRSFAMIAVLASSAAFDGP